MVHLNELQEKYQEKGFEIVSVSREPAASLEKFIEELGATFPIISESGNSMRAYGRTSYPSAFLIGTDGRVLWEGHPGNLSDATIEQHLDEAKILPDFPDALRSIHKYMEKLKYGTALKKLTDMIDREKLEGDDLTTGEEIRDWFTWYATSSLDHAAVNTREDRFYDASVTYESIEDLYKGHDFAGQAKDALKELLSDSDRKLEVKAGQKLAAILAEMAELTPKKALKALQPLLSRKYEDTRAGQEAAEIAQRLEEEED